MTPTLRRRLLFWSPLGLGLLLTLAWLFRPQPVSVDVVSVERGPMRVTVSDEGETRVRDEFVVSAPIPGLMRRIELKVGDPVEAQKTVIARIEPNDPAFLDPRSAAEARAARDAAGAARDYARAQLQRAQAERDFAAAEYKRIEVLAAQRTASENERDSAERRARTAEAQVSEARATLQMRQSEYAQAEARLLSPTRLNARRADCDCITVFSPVSGTVLRVLNESERIVPSGEPLVEVGDPRKLEVVVDLLSADAVRVREGQRALIEAWGGERPLEGVVRRVEPYGFLKVSALGIEEQRVNVIIDLVDPPQTWQRLGHGYRVEPHIVLWESEDVVHVPLSALFRQSDAWAMFVSGNGRAALRTVSVGHTNGLDAEILSGLKAGEQIVVHPSDRVADGVRITERGQ
jgi:HlyD family secretion protein